MSINTFNNTRRISIIFPRSRRRAARLCRFPRARSPAIVIPAAAALPRAGARGINMRRYFISRNKSRRGERGSASFRVRPRIAIPVTSRYRSRPAQPLLAVQLLPLRRVRKKRHPFTPSLPLSFLPSFYSRSEESKTARRICKSGAGRNDHCSRSSLPSISPPHPLPNIPSFPPRILGFGDRPTDQPRTRALA